MTTARLTSSPPEGSGLTSSLNNRLYSAMVKGEPTEQLVVVAILEPVGYGQRKTAKGLHQHVVLDWVALEPLIAGAGDDLDRVRHMIKTAAERRHTPQQRLPLDFGDRNDAEKREELLRLLQTWADDNGHDLDDEWWGYYDRDYIAGPDAASPLQLAEFAHAKGVIDENPVVDDDGGEPPVENVELPDPETVA